MIEKIIDIGKTYTLTPGGRFQDEGPYSGEEFRKTILEPLLQNDPNVLVIIDLDSANGFAASFLEEVFGGIVRTFGPEIIKRVRPRAIWKPWRQKEAENKAKNACQV
jgi:hypothetical protein